MERGVIAGVEVIGVWAEAVWRDQFARNEVAFSGQRWQSLKLLVSSSYSLLIT